MLNVTKPRSDVILVTYGRQPDYTLPKLSHNTWSSILAQPIPILALKVIRS